jgi:4-diphosphocytidyl-2-C-methyl-D-erythritol kinase
VLPVEAQLSAAAVYAEADRLQPPRGDEEIRDLAIAVQQAERSIGVEQAGLAINDLQTAARKLCPEIDAAISLLQQHGAEHAMVSGSGPTVVGLFAPGTATAVQAAIAVERPAIRAVPETRDALEPPRWP